MEELTFNENEMTPPIHVPLEEIERESSDPISRARSRLLDQWLDRMERMAVCPTVRPELWRNLVKTSAESGNPILLAGVSCPTWAQIGSGDDTNSEFLRTMPSGGRPLRFVRALASLQSSLASFGVNIISCLTVSQVEALMWRKLGSERVMTDVGELNQMLEDNQQTLATLCGKVGCKSVFFDHMEFVRRSWGAENDEAVFADVHSERDITTFVQQLIHRDVCGLPDELMELVHRHGDKPVGVVWLDLMAKDVDEERAQVRRAVLTERSDLAAITPFRNVSRWSSGVEPQDEFPDNISMFSFLLGMHPPMGRPREVWLREVLALPDSKVQNVLHGLGIEIRIDSSQKKNQAVGMIERILFNEESFAERNLEQSVTVTANTTILDALSRATGQSKAHIRGCIQSGQVMMNGERLEDGRTVCGDGVLLSIGKRTRIRIHVEVSELPIHPV